MFYSPRFTVLLIFIIYFNGFCNGFNLFESPVQIDKEIHPSTYMTQYHNEPYGELHGPEYGQEPPSYERDIFHSRSEPFLDDAYHFHNENHQLDSNIECPFPYVEVGSICLYFNPLGGPLTWDAARAFCKARNGDLAVFNDTNQYVDAITFLNRYDPRYNCSYWIGGFYNGATFTWITGSPIPSGSPLWGLTSGGILGPATSNPNSTQYVVLDATKFYKLSNVGSGAVTTLKTIALCQTFPIEQKKQRKDRDSSEERGGPSGSGSSAGSGSGGGGSTGASTTTTTTTIAPTSAEDTYTNTVVQKIVSNPQIIVNNTQSVPAPNPVNITIYPPKLRYNIFVPTEFDNDQKYQPPVYTYPPTNNYVPTPYHTTPSNVYEKEKPHFEHKPVHKKPHHTHEPKPNHKPQNKYEPRPTIPPSQNIHRPKPTMTNPQNTYGQPSNGPSPQNTYGQQSNVPSPQNTYGPTQSSKPSSTSGVPNPHQFYHRILKALNTLMNIIEKGTHIPHSRDSAKIPKPSIVGTENSSVNSSPLINGISSPPNGPEIPNNDSRLPKSDSEVRNVDSEGKSTDSGKKIDVSGTELRSESTASNERNDEDALPSGRRNRDRIERIKLLY